MTTDLTRNDVWHGLLDAARLARYYDALFGRYRRRHQTMRFLLLAAATCGIAAVLGPFPERVQLPVYGLIALLAGLDLTFNFAEKAAVLHQVHIDCTELANRWGQLWSEVNRDEADEAEIRARVDQLSRRGLAVTGRAGFVDIPIDPKLNERCAESAYQVTRERYAV